MREFIIRGEKFEINNTRIINALNEVEPEPIRKYFVEINKIRYPIKQVISRVCGIPKLGFTSMDAYHVLRKLGFKVQTQLE